MDTVDPKSQCVPSPARPTADVRQAGEPVPVLELVLLGSPLIRLDEREIAIGFRKSAALLYYLAAQPLRAHSRSHLVALLWEDSNEAAGRNSLSTALSRLRGIAPFPIQSAGDTLRWDPDTAAGTDLARFERLTAAHQDTLDPRDLGEALALYRGPFLDGFEIRDSEGLENWLRQERDHWQQRALAVAQRLATHYQQRGQFADAIRAAQRALSIDALQEPVRRMLMRLYWLMGDRASALAEYRACERILREALDVDPDPETLALRDAILQGRLPSAPLSLDPSPPPRQAEASPPHRARYPMVGRDAELRRIWRLIEASSVRRSRLVVIEGEAGIGKTRLIEEVLSRLRDAGPVTARPGSKRQWTTLLGHSYQDAQGLPYHPFIEALRSQPALLSLDHLHMPDIWLSEINRLLPEVGAQREDLPSPARLDPQQERRRLFEGIARLLMAFPPPRVFILEDIHWADSETLHLLAYLVRHESLSDTLFLATLRSEDVTEVHEQILDSLEYEGWLERVAIPPLSASMTAELVQAVAEDQLGEIAERAYREAEGNPLFTVELVRSLLETGGQAQALPFALSPTVQAVIRSRLARLDLASRELLNSAAIFRRTFDFDEARTVAGQDDEVALGALETLLRLHLLRETVTPIAAGVVATHYRFGHDQVRRVVYDGLSDARRRLLHRRVFDVLVHAGQPHAEELAYHATRSQSWEQALDWSERAADDALRLHAYASAAHLYEQALACVVQLPMSESLRQRAVDIRLCLAQVAFYVHPSRLIEWLEQAEADASQLQDSGHLSRVRLAQASALYILGEFNTALARLEQLNVMAASVEDLPLQAQTNNILGRLLVIRGEFARGLAALERALQAAGTAWSPTALERIASIGLAAAACAFRGQFEAASEWLDRSRQIPDATTDAAAQAADAFYRELVAHTQSDWPATVALAKQAVTSARSADSLIYEYVAQVYLGPALARQGQFAEALTVQQAAIALAERTNTRVILGRAHAYLAEILLLAGQVEAAHDAALRGLELAEEHGHMFEAAISSRIQGEVLTALGLWDEALAALKRARASLAALEAWPEQARADAALGRLYRARGEHGQAAEYLTQAAQRFRELDLNWDLASAQEALATL